MSWYCTLGFGVKREFLQRKREGLSLSFFTSIPCESIPFEVFAIPIIDILKRVDKTNTRLVKIGVFES